MQVHDTANCSGNGNDSTVSVPFSVLFTGFAPGATGTVTAYTQPGGQEVGSRTITLGPDGSRCARVTGDVPAGQYKIVYDFGSGTGKQKVIRIEDDKPKPTASPSKPIGTLTPTPTNSATSSPSASVTATVTPTATGSVTPSSSASTSTSASPGNTTPAPTGTPTTAPGPDGTLTFTPVNTGSGSLPNTGSAAAQLGALAFLSVAVGALLVLVGHRRGPRRL